MTLGPDPTRLGSLLRETTPEAVGAAASQPAEGDRRFRDAGWWPSSGTVVRVVLVAVLVVVGIGWALTLLNK